LEKIYFIVVIVLLNSKSLGHSVLEELSCGNIPNRQGKSYENVVIIDGDGIDS